MLQRVAHSRLHGMRSPVDLDHATAVAIADCTGERWLRALRARLEVGPTCRWPYEERYIASFRPCPTLLTLKVEDMLYGHGWQ